MTTYTPSFQDQNVLDAAQRAESFARGREAAFALLGSARVKQVRQVAYAIIDAIAWNNGFAVDPCEFKRGFDTCALLIDEERAETELRDSVSRSDTASAESQYPELVEWYGGA